MPSVERILTAFFAAALLLLGGLHNATAQTISSQKFSASATATGDISWQTLKGRVNVDAKDIGNPGAVFVVALLPNSAVYYHGLDGTWSPYLQTYSRGTLASGDVGIIESPVDLAVLTGTQVYLGYGNCFPFAMVSRCYDDMNGSGAIQLVHTIVSKGKLAITPYTQPSTNGSVSPLVSVANINGQEITYWGLKDTAGTPFALTEVQFKDATTNTQIRTIYGTHGLPKKFINQKTGEYATVQWGIGGGTFRLYDANGKFTMAYGLSVDGSGKLASTSLASDGQFAVEPDDIALTSPADQLLAKKNVKEIGKVIAAGGVIVCTYSAGALCPAGALMVGIGLATNAAANCEGDCGAGKINNLITTIKDKGNTAMGWFSKGWKSTNDNPASSNGIDPGIPDVIENAPQYKSSEIPTIQQADPVVVQALKQTTPSVSTNSAASPCPNGQYLSALSNLCETTPICPYGYISDNKGYCIRTDMCTTPNVVQNGQCVASAPTSCPLGQEVVNGSCIAKNMTTCGAYQTSYNGSCIPSCISGQVLLNNVCTTPLSTNPPAANTCYGGTIWISSKRQCDCPSGYLWDFSGGFCKPPTTSCGVDQQLVGGQCWQRCENGKIVAPDSAYGCMYETNNTSRPNPGVTTPSGTTTTTQAFCPSYCAAKNYYPCECGSCPSRPTGGSGGTCGKDVAW